MRLPPPGAPAGPCFLVVLGCSPGRWAAGSRRCAKAGCRAGCSAPKRRSTSSPAWIAERAMHWRGYALSLLAFNAVGALAVYGLQRLQHLLPLNPAGMAAVSPDSAFNTAVSFVSNTNWQGYAGESTMSYLTQMLGAHGAELPLRRHRHRGRLRAGARLRGAQHGRQGLRRQLLGRRDAHHRLAAAADLVRDRHRVRGPGRDPELRRLQDGDHAGSHGLPEAQARRRRPAAEGRSRQRR